MRKKQLLFLLLVVSLCLSLHVTALAISSNANTIVYVAPSSYKYHSWSCHYLDDAKQHNTVRSLTLEDAVVEGYDSCTVCDPPDANFPYTVTGNIKQPDVSNSSYTYYTNNSETHPPAVPSNSQPNNNAVVYLSDDDVYYHTHYCSTSPEKKVHLYYAATHGYTACDLCNPPEPNFEYTMSSTPQVSFGSRVVDIVLNVLYWLLMALMLSPVFFAWILPLLLKLVSAVVSLFTKKPKSPISPDPPIPPPPQIPGMPDDTTLGLSGLPREKNCNGTAPWGDKYTVWYSKNGSKYHTFWCEWRSDIPVNVVNIDREPCRVCKPKLPDLEWYYKYKSTESAVTGDALAPSDEGAVSKAD